MMGQRVRTPAGGADLADGVRKLANHRTPRHVAAKSGGGAGIRTPDQGIMIPLLYQLSYTAAGQGS